MMAAKLWQRQQKSGKVSGANKEDLKEIGSDISDNW